jgi:hypothetical protein
MRDDLPIVSPTIITIRCYRTIVPDPRVMAIATLPWNDFLRVTELPCQSSGSMEYGPSRDTSLKILPVNVCLTSMEFEILAYGRCRGDFGDVTGVLTSIGWGHPQSLLELDSRLKTGDEFFPHPYHGFSNRTPVANILLIAIAHSIVQVSSLC